MSAQTNKITIDTHDRVTSSNVNFSGNMSLGYQLRTGQNQIEINGEDFVFMGVNSPMARIQQHNPRNIVGYKVQHKEESETAEVAEHVGSSLLLSLLPMGGLLHALEQIMRTATTAVSENVNKVEISMARNINPVDAINPSRAFLPSSPFYAPKKPEPSLWDRSKLMAQEMSKKKKAKQKGLGQH